MIRLIRKENRKGTLFINKLTSAERQLSAAIRLYFLKEDALAIYTVASAAYSIYSDLLAKRGKKESHWPIFYGLLRAAHDHAHGEISDEFVDQKFGKSSHIVFEFSEMFRSDPELRPEQVSVSGSIQSLDDDWYDLRRPANFLKHADRDEKALADLSKFNHEEIICRSINASFHLNAEFSLEKEFFLSAMYALGFLDDPPDEPSLIWVLSAYEAEEIIELGRRNLCRHLIDQAVDLDHERAKVRMKSPAKLYLSNPNRFPIFERA